MTLTDERHDAGQPTPGLEAAVLAQLREANQNLVIASLRAQTLSETSEHASQQKEHFLATLAHELRNPMAPIVNALAILRRLPTTEPLVPWAHDIIKRQIDHMTRLLDDLLEVSRVQSGKIVLHKRPTTVSEVMLQAVETSAPPIDDRKQRLTVAYPPPALTIDGDLDRLVQVFANLLNNASKYTQEGGTITFSAHEQGDSVVLRVADNGFGIAPDALAGIFDLFSQENRSRHHAHGGLGIGLTVVRAIVEMHGGLVTAQSGGPDLGSTFEVTLPRRRSNPVDAAHETRPGPTPAGTAYRIVLIEDNIDAGTSLKMLLELMGYAVEIATAGAAGVKLIQAQRPQIVLCDIGLPGMDGYAVLAQLREEMASLPVMIALTGHGLPEDKARALSAGFDFHLVKPVDVDELQQLIESQGARISQLHVG